MEGSFAKATRFILTIIEWIKFKIKIPPKDVWRTCGPPHVFWGCVSVYAFYNNFIPLGF
jgi:hypothetical protein